MLLPRSLVYAINPAFAPHRRLLYTCYFLRTQMLHVRSGLGFQEEERRKTFNKRALQICAKRERKDVPHDAHCSWNAVRLVGALFLSAHMTTSARSPNTRRLFLWFPRHRYFLSLLKKGNNRKRVEETRPGRRDAARGSHNYTKRAKLGDLYSHYNVMLFMRSRALPSFHRNGVRYVSVVEDLANTYVHSRE